MSKRRSNGTRRTVKKSSSSASTTRSSLSKTTLEIFMLLNNNSWDTHAAAVAHQMGAASKRVKSMRHVERQQKRQERKTLRPSAKQSWTTSRLFWKSKTRPAEQLKPRAMRVPPVHLSSLSALLPLPHSLLSSECAIICAYVYTSIYL